MYITGVLAQKAGLSHIDHSRHYIHFYDRKTMSVLPRNKNIYLVGNIPNVSVQHKLWNAVQNSAQSLTCAKIIFAVWFSCLSFFKVK